ncbi:MAG: FliM/FliN family flagellar motor switch protein [Polyangiaceae bacterium]
MSAGSPILKLSAEGPRGERACARLAEHGPALASAIRRAIPSLVRRGIQVTFSGVRSTSQSSLFAELHGPTHVTPFNVRSATHVGAFIFDIEAIDATIDGVLGGKGHVATTTRTRLSAAQRAFMSRIGSGVLDACSETWIAREGIPLVVSGKELARSLDDATVVVASFEFGEEGSGGKVLVAFPRDALTDAQAGQDTSVDDSDPRISSVVEAVEVELVAELGRIRMPLSELERMTVGSTFVVGTPVGGVVSVRVRDREILTAEPTTESGHIALRVRSASAA